jgi:hypothetical protein
MIPAEARGVRAVDQAEQGTVLAAGQGLVVELDQPAAGTVTKNGVHHTAGQARVG